MTEQTPESLRAKARELQAEAAKCERDAQALEQRQKQNRLAALIAQETGAQCVTITAVTIGPQDEEYSLEIVTPSGVACLDGAYAGRLIYVCEESARHRRELAKWTADAARTVAAFTRKIG